MPPFFAFCGGPPKTPLSLIKAIRASHNKTILGGRGGSLALKESWIQNSHTSGIRILAFGEGQKTKKPFLTSEPPATLKSLSLKKPHPPLQEEKDRTLPGTPKRRKQPAKKINQKTLPAKSKKAKKKVIP